MWWVFRKRQEKELTELHGNLNLAFSKVRHDISHLYSWVNHLHQHNSNLRNSHSTHATLTKKDIERVSQWIEHLHRNHKELNTYLRETYSHLIELHRKDKELQERLFSMESEITKLKDGARSTILKPPLSPALQKVSVALPSQEAILTIPAIQEFTATEKQVISCIYGSQKPVTYAEIASLVSLNYSTVKNKVYDIRRKGMRVLDSINTRGEKEFYFGEHEKITLSGR